MPKAGEIRYPDELNAAGRRHARDKPFSDAACGRYLQDLGAAMELLPPAPARLLDLGVGSGWTSVFFAKRGYRVTAQDISPGMIELAGENRALHRVEDSLELLVQDYEQMTFSEVFDCAVFYDSLHHAEDEAAALAAVYRALKPNGICVTVEPGKGHAAATGSKEAVRHYGVTEKDMDPAHIIGLAHTIGFRRFEVYHRTQVPRLLAEGNCDALPAPVGRLELTARYFDAALRCLFFGKRRRDPEALGLIPSTTFVYPNFVRLTK